MSAAASEVVPWLRGLGFRIAEANAAAALCSEMADTPIEQRVRVALGYFRKACPNRPAAMA
jgi:signal transduction protein with GAF and PtsI domain